MVINLNIEVMGIYPFYWF